MEGEIPTQSVAHANVVLHLIPSEEVRIACRQRIEACELWLRRLAHDRLTEVFGSNYLEVVLTNGQPLFSASVRKDVLARMNTDPPRYSRLIDALVLGELTRLICKPDVYASHFESAFKAAFISADHLRSTLDRLTALRNTLAHAGPLAVADAERIFGYCTDISSALGAHYAESGMKDEFDAPSFVRFSDSLGHVAHPTSSEMQIDYAHERRLRYGDFIRLEVEVDPRFAPEDYVVGWEIANNYSVDRRVGLSFELALGSEHVGRSALVVIASVTSVRTWHRHGKTDARLVLAYSVSPPL